MYWAGGCPGRVNRSGKPYPGERRWFEPSPPVKPAVYWRNLAEEVLMGVAYFAMVMVLVVIAIITLT